MGGWRRVSSRKDDKRGQAEGEDRAGGILRMDGWMGGFYFGARYLLRYVSTQLQQNWGGKDLCIKMECAGSETMPLTKSKGNGMGRGVDDGGRYRVPVDDDGDSFSIRYGYDTI